MVSLKQAIEAAGISQSDLASRVGVHRSAITHWDKVPAERVIRVSEAMSWRVTPHQLRPDLYPNPTDGIPLCRVVCCCED